ncbi:MAG: type II toxin-antitoxin system PemK/MazF family toxin [Gemmatimonadetes bacterium]|nr:type II toxin-antitoxin system PemK/MazF family toxin [Gemmatimonadota bacterium]
MVIERGEVWWADLGEPRGAAPGYRRPVVIVQADAFNRSRIETTIVVILTSNLALLDAPGNVLVPARDTGLKRDSVANVSQLGTLDRQVLAQRVGRVSPKVMGEIEDGLRLVLGVR